MTTFYNSASTEQSVLLVCLFFSLVLSLFCFIVSLTRSRKRWITVLNAGIYLALFVLLSTLTESFSKIREGREYRTLLPLPMWSLWVHYRHNRSFSHFRCNCSFSSEKPRTRP